MSVYKWYIGLLSNVLSVFFKSIGVVRVASKSWKKEVEYWCPSPTFLAFLRSSNQVTLLYTPPPFPLRFEVNIPCIIIILIVNKIDRSPLPLSLNIRSPLAFFFLGVWHAMKHSLVITPLELLSEVTNFILFIVLRAFSYFMVTPFQISNKLPVLRTLTVEFLVKTYLLINALASKYRIGW